MKSLYESILDDEDDIIDRMGGEISDVEVVLKLKKDRWGIADKDNIYLTKRGIVVDCSISRYDTQLDAILNETDVNIYKMKSLLRHDKGSIEWSHKLHIKNLHELGLDSYSAAEVTKDNLLIDKLELFTLNIRWIDPDWIKVFDNIKSVNTVRLFGSYEIWGLKMHPTDNIKNIKTNKLYMICELFPGNKITPNTREFLLTDESKLVLDNIYKYNKFKELYILNVNKKLQMYKIERIGNKYKRIAMR